MTKLSEKSLILKCLEDDVNSLLHRFFTNTTTEQICLRSFVDLWKSPECHFSVMHFTFDTNKVDYPIFLQSFFESIMRNFWIVPDEIRSISHLSSMPPELLLSVWNLVVLFALYCCHGTQRQRSVFGPIPIRVDMTKFGHLLRMYTVQIKSLMRFTKVGREAAAIFQCLLVTENAFVLSSYTGPVRINGSIGACKQKSKLKELFRDDFALPTREVVLSYLEMYEDGEFDRDEHASSQRIDKSISEERVLLAEELMAMFGQQQPSVNREPLLVQPASSPHRASVSSAVLDELEASTRSVLLPADSQSSSPTVPASSFSTGNKQHQANRTKRTSSNRGNPALSLTGPDQPQTKRTSSNRGNPALSLTGPDQPQTRRTSSNRSNPALSILDGLEIAINEILGMEKK